MANLQSTAPGAFAALYTLLNAAGQAQTPKVAVFNQSVQSYEPVNGYVLLGNTPSGLKAVSNHRYEARSLPYQFIETYDINGYVAYFQGDVDPATVITKTWSLYESVVQATVVANAGVASLGQAGAVLGYSGPGDLQWILPAGAEYSGTPTDQAGFGGIVEFSYSLQAWLTVQ